MTPSSPFYQPAHTPVMLHAPTFRLASPVVLSSSEPSSRRSSVDRPVDSSAGALERAMRRYEGAPAAAAAAREFGRKRQVSGGDIPAPLVLERSAHAFGAPWSDVPRPATLQVPGTAATMQYGWSDGSASSYGPAAAAEFNFSPHMPYNGQTPELGSGYSSLSASSSPASSVSGFSPIVQPAKLFDWRGRASIDGLEPLRPASPPAIPPPPFAWHQHARTPSVVNAEAAHAYAMPRSEFPTFSAVPQSFSGFDFLASPDTISLADIHPLA